MSAMVLMFRNSSERGGRDLFSCSNLEWQFLQRLGVTFGWRPQGTTYEAPAASKVTPAYRNYEPGEAADRKQVSGDDALEWARSLDAARGSTHFDAMLDAASTQEQTTVKSLSGLIDEFTAYAYGGSFSFASAAEPHVPR